MWRCFNLPSDMLRRQLEALRGPTCSGLVPDSLVCSICHDVIVSPFILHCGHGFCALCLRSWLAQKMACPMCRATITSKPVPCVQLHELVEQVLRALNETDPEAVDAIRSQKPPAEPYSSLYFSEVFANATNAVQDIDDAVMRCGYCLWEVDEDGVCPNCHRRSLLANRESPEEDSFGLDSESEVEIVPTRRWRECSDEEFEEEDLDFIDDSMSQGFSEGSGEGHVYFVDVPRRRHAIDSESELDSDEIDLR